MFDLLAKQLPSERLLPVIPQLEAQGFLSSWAATMAFCMDDLPCGSTFADLVAEHGVR